MSELPADLADFHAECRDHYGDIWQTMDALFTRAIVAERAALAGLHRDEHVRDCPCCSRGEGYCVHGAPLSEEYRHALAAFLHLREKPHA